MAEITKLTDADVFGMRVSNLANRPTNSSGYGGHGLSATELKARMDQYADAIRAKLNALIDAFNDAEIPIAFSWNGTTIADLQALANLIASPDFATYLTVYNDEDEPQSENLKDYIKSFRIVSATASSSSGTAGDGRVTTWTVTMENGSTFSFAVKDGVKGDKGDKGDIGNGIVSIQKTNTTGLVDTYTVTYTDGQTTFFTVTNGAKGETGETGAKGDKGDKGDTGAKGDTGEKGEKGEKGDKGDKGDTGAPFSVSKTYASVAAMNAGYATDGVAENGFVLIDTGNVQDEDNAKLYRKGASAYVYLTDLSGAQGIKGEKGDKGDTGDKGEKGEKGDTGAKGDKGDKGDTGAQGTPGAQGAKGDTGVGISSISLVGTNGLVDTYRITLTDGNTFDFTVTNGSDAVFSIPYVEISTANGDTIDTSGSYPTITLSAAHSEIFRSKDFIRVRCDALFDYGSGGETYVFQRTFNEPVSNSAEKVEYFSNIDVSLQGTHSYQLWYTTSNVSQIVLTLGEYTVEGGGTADYYTAEEIDALWYGSYTITASVTNGTGTSGSITGKPTATASITITPSEGYTLPATVTVTNATLTSYDDTTGVVTVTAATGNVTVTAVCESEPWDGTDLTGTKWQWNDASNLKSWGQAGTLFRSWTYGGNDWENYYFNVEADLTLLSSSTISKCYYFTGSYNKTTNTNSSVYYSKTSQTPTSSTQLYNFANVISFEFTGGSDVTNATLISWLQSNATLISW